MPRKIQIKKGTLTLKENVEEIQEKTIKPFGNSARIDSQKKHIGKRTYVIILKN